MKMRHITLDEILNDGFTERFAKSYYNTLEEEKKSGIFEKEFLEYAHQNGFFASSLAVYDLEHNKLEDYLSDYDYYRLWPHNNWMRIWINDKLTLKYILNGTAMADVMPKYYYYYGTDGLRSLVDNKTYDQSVDGLLKCIREKKNIACKPNNGQEGRGFSKISYNEGYYINEKACSEKDIRQFIESNPNYIYTEFLFPAKELADLSDNKIHTLRIMILNQDGISPKLFGGYFRFATKAHGTTNVSNFDHESEADFNIVSDINLETGVFGNTKAVFKEKQCAMEFHPDSGYEIKGKIPNWEKMKDVVLEITKIFFGVEWMGIDACIDSHGDFRIMEINSFSGIKNVQLNFPFLKDQDIKKYFQNRIEQIERMNELEKELRRKIIR